MGNSKSYHDKKVTLPSSPGEWISAGNTGYCELVKNTKTGLVAEQYHIQLDTRIPHEQNEEIYEERRIQNDNLVAVYQVEKQKDQYLCQGKEFLTVRSERIPYRLSQMNNLAFKQTLYILREAAVGYHAITDFYGPIIITDEMIGFTPNHRVKVWLNQQFAHNLPRENANIFLRQPAYVEQRLPNTISQLFSVVEQHCQNGQFPEMFSKAYRQYPIQTFSEALQFIEDYANKKGIDIKSSIASQSNVTLRTDKTVSEKQITSPRLQSYTPTTPPLPPRASLGDAGRVQKQPATEVRKYYYIPQTKTQKRYITATELNKQIKLDPRQIFQPNTNIQSSNIIHPPRKISKTDNQLNFKIVSPRDHKLTFATTGSRATKNTQTQKITTSQIHLGKNNPHSIIMSNGSSSNSTSFPSSRYQHHEGVVYPGPSFKSPIVSGDMIKYLSPAKLIPKQVVTHHDHKLSETRIVEKESKSRLMPTYEKLSSQTKSTIEVRPKVEKEVKEMKIIATHYPKPPKLAFKA